MSAHLAVMWRGSRGGRSPSSSLVSSTLMNWLRELTDDDAVLAARAGQSRIQVVRPGAVGVKQTLSSVSFMHENYPASGRERVP